jgi:hypothetical protein
MHALFACVVNSDDDERLNLALGDQCVCRFADSPMHAGDERRAGIEEILPILKVQDGKARPRILNVRLGKIDDKVARGGKKAGAKTYVLAQTVRVQARSLSWRIMRIDE